MNEKELKKYKRQKLFKTKLFWGITAGIIFAIIVIVTLPVLSIREINRQTDALETQVKSDLDLPTLMPLKETFTPADIDEFYDGVSATNYDDFSNNTFLTNKVDNLKVEEQLSNLSWNKLVEYTFKAIQDVPAAVLYLLEHSIGENVNASFLDDNDQSKVWGDQNLVGTKATKDGKEFIQNANDLGDSNPISVGWKDKQVTLFGGKDDQVLMTNDETVTLPSTIPVIGGKKMPNITSLAVTLGVRISYYHLEPIDIDLSDADADKTFDWWKVDSFDFTDEDGTVIPVQVNQPSFLLETTNEYEYFLNLHTPTNLLAGKIKPSINLSLGNNIDFATFVALIEKVIDDINADHFSDIIAFVTNALKHILEDPSLEGINFFLSLNTMNYSTFAKDENEDFIHSNTSYVINNYLKWALKDYSKYFDANEDSGYKKLVLNSTSNEYEFVDIKQPSERMTYLARVMELDAFKADFNNLNKDNKFLDWVKTNDGSPTLPAGIDWNDNAYRFGVLYYLVDNYYMLWDGKFRNTKTQIIDDALSHVKLSDIPYPF